MKKIFLINAFTQTVEALYLNSLSNEKQEIIGMARDYPDVVGKVNENVILRIVKNKSLSIKITNKEYSGGMFIVANNIKVDDSNLLHIPLFQKISFHTYIAREIIRLAKNDYYRLDDKVKVSFSQTISIRDFIKKAIKLNGHKLNEMYRELYQANNNILDDRPIYTIEHFIKRYAL